MKPLGTGVPQDLHKDMGRQLKAVSEDILVVKRYRLTMRIVEFLENIHLVFIQSGFQLFFIEAHFVQLDEHFPVRGDGLVYLSIVYHLSTDYILALTEREVVPEIPDDYSTFLAKWENEKPYCKRIQELRKENGLTQEQAAKAICCSQQTYSCYENGTRGIMAKVLVALARFYNVSTDYILGLRDER